MTVDRGPGEAGFTLIEVMVSLMIFGMIAAAGVAILSFSVRAQSSTGAKLDDISALTRTMSILSADLAQASNRVTRDEAGTRIPAFVGESGSGVTPMLRLVRAGWSNIDGTARSNLQKVAYRVDAGTLQVVLSLLFHIKRHRAVGGGTRRRRQRTHPHAV